MVLVVSLKSISLLVQLFSLRSSISCVMYKSVAPLLLMASHRYIQGVRLLGSSNNDNAEIPIEIDAPVGEMTAISTLAPPSATMQARFIGQGYKQVKILLVQMHYSFEQI